jgi:hypothetical protein
MKKIIILGAIAVVAGGVIWSVGLPEHPYQLVSEQYNFSASFPDTPTIKQSINDEGKPKTEWTVKHDHGNWVEYYQVSGTCYDEVLDPAKEFGGADDDPTLLLNGVKVLKSERYMVHALKTGKELPAFSRVSKDTATGNVMSHFVILDGHCMIDAGARIDRNEGPASLFMGNIKMLK